jgi:hypothetical protein
MNGGILHNLPAIVVYELITKGGDINGKGQNEDNADSLPGRWAGSVGGGGQNWQSLSTFAGCQDVVAEPAHSVHPIHGTHAATSWKVFPPQWHCDPQAWGDLVTGDKCREGLAAFPAAIPNL